MLDAPNLARRIAPCIDPRLVGKHGQQAAVARVEVEVTLISLSQVGLLEDERHPEHALPEINGALPV